MITKKQKKWDKRLATFVTTVLLVLIIGVISVSAMFAIPQNSVYITEINNFENKNTTKEVRTDAKTVGEFLKEQNIVLSAHDTLNHNESVPLGNGMKVVVTRGRAFTIETDGQYVLCSTTQGTVGKALLQAGYYPEENDVLNHDLKSEVTDGLVVTLTEVTTETAVITEAIPNTTENREDATIESGTTKVIQEGYNGECEVTVNITYNNGVEVSREEVSRVTTKEPQNKIVANGTKEKVMATPTPAPSSTPKATQKANTQTQPEKVQQVSAQKTPASTPQAVENATAGTIAGFSYSRKITMSATGYTAFNSDGSRGTTATGRPAGQGIVAVDPKVIPLGTRVYVEGYGEAIAADVGGAIKGNKIDLCFEWSNARIRQEFGRRNVTVYILN